MFSRKLIQQALEAGCPFIHQTRLDAVMDVAYALQHSQNLSLSEMGRNLAGKSDVKHRIKKVDRLEGNEKLHSELQELYMGLSGYVFTYISQDKKLPIMVDLCFMKDDRTIQMLSAEFASKGRTIPVYREIFKEGELKNRAKSFLKNLATCLPKDRQVIIGMDAGFGEDWFKNIQSHGWHWVCRVRGEKNLKFPKAEKWISIKEFIPTVNERTTDYKEVLLTKEHQHSCRIVTTRKSSAGRKAKTRRGVITNKIAGGAYSKAAKEPWILATNLPVEYKATEVVNLYSKRMQIEESFRDVKSHQFGLGGRYVRTTCTHRWGVKMLLAAIVQITYWVIGVIGHSQGMQRHFQANTVKDKKVFSYFTLGRFIIEYDKLDRIEFGQRKLALLIQEELARVW